MAFQYRRPYYPYVNRYQRYGQTNPGQAMTSAIEGGTKLGEQAAKVMAQMKQDQIANQLAAQYGLYAPRAQWVGGTPPPAGVNTQGTTLADQGGVEGLKLRMAMQQRDQQQKAAQAKAQLQQALVDQQRGKAKSVWTGRNQNVQQPGQTGKTGAYKAGAYNYENGTLNGQKTADSMEYIQKDLDGATGKTGTAASLLAALPQIKIVNGKPTIPVPLGADGKPDPNYKPSYRFNDDGSFSVLDRNGNPSATIQSSDLQTTLNRLNALKIRNGETPLPNPYLAGTEKNSTFNPGSKENPFALDPNKPNTTFRALPFGSYFKDPKGNIQLKQDPTQAQKVAQNPATPNVPANQFAPPSEGGTSTDITVPPPTANLPGHIPTRPTASTDDSGSNLQKLSYLNGVQPDNTPVSPNAPVDSSGGTIAKIDPNTFAPPSQQSPAQVADVALPNRDVVPTATGDNTDLLNRMIAGQSLLDQSIQT